jgi:hypothetical protein
LTEVLAIFLDGGPTPTLDQWLTNPAAFNHEQVRLRNDRSARAVLTEYLEVCDAVMSLATRIRAEVWWQPGILPWHGGQYCLDDFIVYQSYGHKREHSAEIAAFLYRISQRVPTV